EGEEQRAEVLQRAKQDLKIQEANRDDLYREHIDLDGVGYSGVAQQEVEIPPLSSRYLKRSPIYKKTIRTKQRKESGAALKAMTRQQEFHHLEVHDVEEGRINEGLQAKENVVEIKFKLKLSHVSFDGYYVRNWGRALLIWYTVSENDIPSGSKMPGYRSNNDVQGMHNATRATDPIEAYYDRYLQSGVGGKSARSTTNGVINHPIDGPYVMDTVGSKSIATKCKDFGFGGGRPECEIVYLNLVGYKFDEHDHDSANLRMQFANRPSARL
ncbi:hypothetical protein HAX54_014856, partial [Datura stramonium]|nr:hypothetical protein [Datura stramonium]